VSRPILMRQLFFYFLFPVSFCKRQYLNCPVFNPSFFPLFYFPLWFLQIGEFDLVQEATPVVDKDLLKVVTLVAKSCGVTA